jgi:hypothetical protein
MSVTSSAIGEITILESGDALSEPLRERLTRPEFERRYRAMPQLKKAELIEGVVYVASRASKQHDSILVIRVHPHVQQKHPSDQA